MRLNKEEVEALVQDQTADDDAIEVQKISGFHESSSLRDSPKPFTRAEILRSYRPKIMSFG